MTKPASSIKVRLNAYGPAGLLGLAFALQGAKTEIAFAIWGLVALAWTAWSIAMQTPSLRAARGACIFLAGLILSQLFSRDKSASFFWTMQWMTMTLFWIALRSEGAALRDFSYVRVVLRIAGVVTVILTTRQHFAGIAAWGWLPINTDWNAAWMAVTALYLLPSDSDSRFWKYADGALCIALLILTALSTSRSAILGLLAAAVVHQRTNDHWEWDRILLAFLLGGAALIPTPWFQSRLAGTLHEIQSGGRLEIWRTALHALADHPLWGFGAGNFELAYLKHAIPVFLNPVYYDLTTAFAHNEVLQSLIELGWPTGLVLLAGVGLVFKSFKIPGHLPEKTAVTALAAMALVNPTFHLPLLLFAMILFASPLLPVKQEHLNSTDARHWFKSGLLCIIFFTAGGVLWRGIRSSWAQQQHWDRIVLVCSSDADAWHQWGNLQAPRQNASFQALAIHWSPNEPYYYESFGRALESAGLNLPMALQAYLKATELAPKRAVNYLAIGRLLFRQGHPSDALPWFGKAIAIEPFYWEADLWSARCYFAAGNAKRAVQILDSLDRRHSDFLLHYPMLNTPSPYQQTILGYDGGIIRQQRQAFLDKMRHSPSAL